MFSRTRIYLRGSPFRRGRRRRPTPMGCRRFDLIGTGAIHRAEERSALPQWGGGWDKGRGKAFSRAASWAALGLLAAAWLLRR